MRTIIAGLAFAALAGAAQAQAPVREKPADLADLQCMAIYAIMANQPEHQSGAALGVFYHLGRLEGRGPGVDWLDRMRTYADATTLAELAPHGDRCGEEMSRAAQAMQAVGASMTD